MSALKVRLFGSFSVQRDGRVLDGMAGSKARELFCYLLLHRTHPQPRESLAGRLWSECPTAHSKKYLRQALWQLQAALSSDPEPLGARVLLADSNWVRLNPEADLWLDVAAFERACECSVPGHKLDARGAQAVRQAVQLYQGDLLDGWYQDWCLYERERLQNMYLAMLDELMAYGEFQHEYKSGLAYGERVLRYDPARERTHQRLMRLLYLAGDRAGALRQYQRCVAALAEELSVKPSARTVALYEQIRADRLLDWNPAPPEHNGSPEEPSSQLPELLGRLKRLRSDLASYQRQVEQDIHGIERTLSEHHQPNRQSSAAPQTLTDLRYKLP